MKIVVGVEDGSPSMAALRRARAIAEDLEADLHVVFVAHVPATVLAAMSGLPTVADDFAEAQRSNVWKGYPPDVLVGYAEKIGADMIVVGSRGRGDLASLVLGSTSHRVVNHAPCDVLVAREREGEE